jgi:3-oxoacyl-[acyl-carrier protein] reductase
MDLGIRDKVALVTGSSRGIGKAIATGLAREGARVVICARNLEDLRVTALEIRTSTGSEVSYKTTDLKQRQDIVDLVDHTVETFEGLDILVNNTGGPPPMLFRETSREDWYTAIDLLLMSVIHSCQQAIPYMRRNRWGRIINMTSFAAKEPAERLILSNSIRAGILGLSKTLSNELAKTGITVNSVCPGWTLTNRVRELLEDQGESYEEELEKLSSNIPMRRLAEPEEIANAVVFLASDKASYMTGSVIQVDGGYISSVM